MISYYYQKEYTTPKPTIQSDANQKNQIKLQNV